MRGTIVKRLFTVSGLLLVFGLGTAPYAVRELMAAFAIFSVGFAALLLITLISFLALYVSRGGTRWLRIRAPQWNRARRDWVVEFFHLLNEIAKQARTVHWFRLWQGPTRRIPNAKMFISEQTRVLAAPSMVLQEKKRTVALAWPIHPLQPDGHGPNLH